MRTRTTEKATAYEQRALRKHKRRLRQLELVMRRYPEADREDVLHTLIALEKSPWENLERSLLRGRGVEIHFR
jgi:hypothetical protein